MADPGPWTSAAALDALKLRYCQPEWAIFFEVANATGARASRYADAVAMSLWPSRGLEIHGFEVKVSRSDWMNEKRNPEKAENIAAYCDRWWLVAPSFVVREEEIPPLWGWLELYPKGLKIRKQAGASGNVKPRDRAFMAALMRRCGQASDAQIRELVKRETVGIRAEVDKAREQLSSISKVKYDQLAARVAAFEEASGIRITDGWGESCSAEVGAAVAAIRTAGLSQPYGAMLKLEKTLELALSGLKAGMAMYPQPNGEAD